MTTPEPTQFLTSPTGPEVFLGEIEEALQRHLLPDVALFEAVRTDVMNAVTDLIKVPCFPCTSNAEGGDEVMNLHPACATVLYGQPEPAASGVQPDTRPEGYGDGKGRAYCLRCAHHVGASVPLTANDVDAYELCPSCGRHVVDAAQEAYASRPVPDTELIEPVPDTKRCERWEARYSAYVNSDEDPGTGSDVGDLAAIGRALADQEQCGLRDENASLGRTIRDLEALIARQDREKASQRAAIIRLRAELGKARRYRSAWLSARSRAAAYGEGILRHVKDRETYQGWLKTTQTRVAALEKLRRMAAAAPGGQAEDGAQQK